jgi:peptidoglycan/LPS O-acetylase OafA/YrhL
MDQRSANRVEFLDGVRGWASLAVLLSHLIIAFASKEIPFLDFNSARLNADIQNLNVPDLLLGMLLFFFANGDLAVMIFFVLSGYVLTCRQLDPNNRNLALAASTRYFRLMLPIFFTSLFAYVLMKSNLMYNQDVVKIDGRYATWLGSFYNFEANFTSFIRFSLVDVFFNYNKNMSYNPVLWTMSFELLGSFLVFSYLGVFKTTPKVNWLVLVVLVLFFFVVSPMYSCFLLGHALAEMERSEYKTITQSKLGKRNFEVFHLVLFILVAVLATPLRNSLHAHAVLATIFVYACLNSNRLRSFFSNSFSKFLGQISFPLYLVQIPIICSLSSWMYLTFRSQGIDGQLAASMNFAVTLLACFGLSILVLPIERLSIAWSKKVGKALISF